MEIIQNKNWKLMVDLNGGRIRELSYKGKIILGTFKRIDEKEGNTHICCPNFGGEGMEKFGLPFHGPFRNLVWRLISKGTTKVEIEAENLGLNIRQIFSLDNNFEQIVRIKNLNNEPRKINMAIHNYWDTKDGWQKTKLNGEIIDELIKSDTDKDLLPINILEISGKGKYRWCVKGFKYQRFWTAFKDTVDGKKYDQDYICVEPSLEKQGFLDNESGFNLLGLKSLEVAQTIEPTV